MDKLFEKANKDKIFAKTLSQTFIESGDAEANYLIVLNVKNVDKAAHGSAVIASRDPEYNYLFARDVKGADILGHGQAIIKSGNQEYNYGYAMDIPGADTEAHRHEAIRSRETLYIRLFEKYVKSDDNTPIGKKLTEGQIRTRKLDRLAIERMNLKAQDCQNQTDTQKHKSQKKYKLTYGEVKRKKPSDIQNSDTQK